MTDSGGRLSDRVSKITASAEGIGLEIAKRFLKEGSKLVICSRKQPKVDSAFKKLHKLADALKIPRDHVIGLVFHVGTSEQRANLI